MSERTEPAVQARGLSKRYEVYPRPQDRLWQSLWRGRRQFYYPVQALRDVSFSVPFGSTLGILGRNGSGKSTLLQIVTGILAATEGEVHVAGRVAGLLELGAGFNPDFTGRENVRLNAAILGLSARELERRFPAILDFAEIGDFVDQPVKTYSSGMYMRLAFATAIHVAPDILVVDEALAVGDEAFQRKCFRRLETMRKEGTTLLLVSHASRTIVELCDRALLLDEGERLLLGPPEYVVGQYHKLIYAAPERQDAIREELRGLDRGGEEEGSPAGRVASSEGEAHSQDDEEESGALFDPELQPKSTTHYESRGALIEDVALRDGRGRAVNLLVRGRVYEIAYRVRFDETCHRVRFGTTLSSLTGVDLCSIMSHAPGDAVERVERGTLAEIRLRFRASLLPYPYFVRVGCTGMVGDQEVFLHRIIDALMFRMLPERGLSVAGWVDLSESPSCELKLASGRDPGTT